MPALGPTSAQFNTGYLQILDAEFLRRLSDDGLSAVKGASWTTSCSVIDTELEVLASAQYETNATDEVLVRIGSSIAQLIQCDRALTVRIGAPSVDDIVGAETSLRAAFPLPSADEEQAELKFWWSRPNFGPATVTRAMQVQPFSAIEGNYSAMTRTGMSELVALHRPEGRGRLLLLHGQPGTGKTHAVLSLAREWSEWAEFGFITDPEKLFADPGYLLEVISRRSLTSSGRWQVLVLEDAGEFLTPFAKAENGQALSRLLNITDGALGTATKTLLLITTNEEVRELHPAASRPGRCLAQVPCTALTRSEAIDWCRAQMVDAVPSRSMTLAELYALRAGRPAGDINAGFGFAVA